MILNILCNAIDFILGLDDFNLRVGAGHGINLTALLLFFKYRSLSDTDCELHIR